MHASIQSLRSRFDASPRRQIAAVAVAETLDFLSNGSAYDDFGNESEVEINVNDAPEDTEEDTEDTEEDTEDTEDTAEDTEFTEDTEDTTEDTKDNEDTDSVIAALTSAGFLQFLEGDLGGAKLTRDATRIMKNTARFLKWSYKEVKKAGIPQQSVLQWLENIITYQYITLSLYASHCANVLCFKPSTVRNHIGDIMVACEWYTIYGAGASSLPGEVLVKVRHVATAVRKLQVRREKDIRSRVSMDSKVRERRMPSGGLAELQRVVNRRIPWAMSLQDTKINEEDYKQVLGLLYSTLYVYSVQGRISGIMDLTFDQAQELLTSGYVTTDQFKTNDKWGLQPVTLSVRALQLLELYLHSLRPHAMERSVVTPVNALWVTFHGERDKLVGQRVTAFFKRHLQLHITTTAIRSLVETTMDTLHVQGRITAEQRASVHSINGHSGAVAKDYYIHKVRGEDVQHAREAFLEMFDRSDDAAVDDDDNNDNNGPSGHARSPQAVSVSARGPEPPSSWQERTAPVAIDFGTAHPDYKSTSIKAHWTDEEKEYVGKWCARVLNENQFTCNVVAKCRAHILDDPAAWPIFHANHVLDSGRLRNGYRSWTKEQDQLGK
jgi:hypothetical protein